jgi:hypothetical protein
MTRNIIDCEEGYGISVNTFWMGDKEGVQLTSQTDKGYVQMSREKAIEFFKKGLNRLKKQKDKDKMKPPWWQKMNSLEEFKGCKRCGKETDVFIMSMFNKDLICMECKSKEEKHPKYREAIEKNNEEIRKGNYTFNGIGKPEDL